MDVLYPMVEKKLGAKGKESAAHAAEDHAQIERDLMEALQKRKVGGWLAGRLLGSTSNVCRCAAFGHPWPP